ncbi:biotin transporter BioY [Bifidobacterium jacchi]|uniref:Biotin transporter n=1 Tax=Bifidobacterium jacchi TaxID=2490545 RepID=A0A5N5RF45_9BIFI|nr:biotin transporter BioY [Bifidobacterium jacchi]KAB5605853.1 biotin transporter BioY [Bifidobacterium jacchi]
MQPTSATAASTSSTRRMLRVTGHIAKSLLFAGLMWAAAAAGELPIPGTPVPITLQTFVVMMAALMLDWREAASAVVAYLAAGAVGLPVFAGGASTAALFGPSAGFLIGFLPGVIVAALLKGRAHTDSFNASLRTASRYFAASLLGGVVVVYLIGFAVQSSLTHVPFGVVAAASMGFVIGDVIKAAVASLAAAGLARLR